MIGIEITNPETGTTLLNLFSKVLTIKSREVLPESNKDSQEIKGNVVSNSSPERMIFHVYLSNNSTINFPWFSHTGDSLIAISLNVYGIAQDISTPVQDTNTFVKVTTEYIQPTYTKGFLEVFNENSELQWSDQTLNQVVSILEVHPIENTVLDLSKYVNLGLENIYFGCTAQGYYDQIDFGSYEIRSVYVQKKGNSYRILSDIPKESGTIFVGYLRPN